MKNLSRIPALCGIFFLTCGGAFGWGSVEHKVIARIAWENLNAETKAAVVQLMLKAPQDSGVQTIYLAAAGDIPLQPRRFFVDASIWADLVRVPGQEERRSKYHCPQWHYAEFTFAEPGIEIPDLPAFKPRQVNVMERLQFFQTVLVDDDEPISNRAIELIWTIHLVGDIHQPLHITSRVTRLEPESDLGGNKFKIGSRNLHAYWDQILARNYKRSEGKAEDVYITEIADLVMREYPRKDLADGLARTKPEDWAAESFELAKSAVYAGVTRSEEPSAEYQSQALKTAKLRIALAGYRLAQMLNRLFSSSNQPQPSAARVSTDTQKIKARLAFDLACVTATLDQKTQGLVIVKGTALEGQSEGQQVEGFNSDQVKNIAGETKQALLESLAGEELAGLRAYVIKQFPDANQLETVRVSDPVTALLMPSSQPSSQWLVKTNLNYSRTPPERNIAPLPAVNNLIGQIRGLLSGIRRRSGPIRLEVVTRPQTGANIVLQAPGGKRYATSTNSHIIDFWPGTYNFTVTRDGSVTITHSSVDLGFSYSVIDCQLVSSGTPVFCQFR